MSKPVQKLLRVRYLCFNAPSKQLCCILLRHVVVPIAKEFQPDLVIVSAGKCVAGPLQAYKLTELTYLS